MIKLQPISTSDLQHYKFMEELLVDAFPPEEYRQLEELREYTDRTGNFHNNIIFVNNHLLHTRLPGNSFVGQPE
mgnify:CR=1 FL=1